MLPQCVVKVLRDWYMGCALAFQAIEKSSNLLSRSKLSQFLCDFKKGRKNANGLA